LKTKPLFFALVFLMLLSSCGINNNPGPTSSYKPILIKRSEANDFIQITKAKNFTNTGNGFLYGNIFFLVEESKGIHLIDKTDNNNNLPFAFIELFNLTDVYVIGDFLYANQSVDLVVLDISDIENNNILSISRVMNVNEDIPPDNLPLKDEFNLNRPENTIVYRWEYIWSNNFFFL